MKRTIAGTLAVMLGTLAPLWNPAWAQNNLQKAANILAQQERAGRGEFITYLEGAAAAYRWAGSSSNGGDRTPLYCPPDDNPLAGKAYAKIALDEYNRAKDDYHAVEGYPLTVLSLALMHGLQRKYPCPTQAKAHQASPAATTAADAKPATTAADPAPAQAKTSSVQVPR